MNRKQIDLTIICALVTPFVKLCFWGDLWCYTTERRSQNREKKTDPMELLASAFNLYNSQLWKAWARVGVLLLVKCKHFSLKREFCQSPLPICMQRQHPRHFQLLKYTPHTYERQNNTHSEQAPLAFTHLQILLCSHVNSHMLRTKTQILPLI